MVFSSVFVTGRPIVMCKNIYRAWCSRFLAIVYGCQTRQVECRNVRGTESQKPYDWRWIHFQTVNNKLNKRSGRRRGQLRNQAQLPVQCVDAMEFLWKRNVVRKKLITSVVVITRTALYVGTSHTINVQCTAARKIYVFICARHARMRIKTSDKWSNGWPWHYVGGRNANSIIDRI